MLGFLDLPVELLPPILGYIRKTSDLYRLALVNKMFNEVARPLLYRSVSVPASRPDAQEKVVFLQQSLNVEYLTRRESEVDPLLGSLGQEITCCARPSIR